MNSFIKKSLFLFYSIIIIFLSGCTHSMEYVSTQMPSHQPVGDESQLALIPSQKINVKIVRSRYIPTQLEGTRSAAFDLKFGSVGFNPTAAEIVKNVLVSELTYAGHNVTDKDQQVNIVLQILTLNISTTDENLLYWNITGNTSFEIEVMNLNESIFKKTYTSFCQQRTYKFPDEELFKEVLHECLADFASAMQNDIDLAQAITKVAQEQHNPSEEILHSK